MLELAIIPGAIALIGAVVAPAFLFRRVVPANEIHIVQSTSNTLAYGQTTGNGNVYYSWPESVPKFGVSVKKLRSNIFTVKLSDYEAFDKDKLPFIVDVTAFFRIADPVKASTRNSDQQTLEKDLQEAVRGAVRRILANNAINEIMESRGSLGLQFTNEVKGQIEEWGVVTTKNIEFMDIRDRKDSKVIADIESVHRARIDCESRVAVAEQTREATLAEITAKQMIDIRAEQARRETALAKAQQEQEVGLRKAEQQQQVGVREQQAKEAVMRAQQQALIAQLEQEQIQARRQAEIQTEQNLIMAEGQRRKDVQLAEAERDVSLIRLEAQQRDAEIQAQNRLILANADAQSKQSIGLAEAEAERARMLASVAAQTELANQIGSNEAYQQYLITIRQVEANERIGIEQAKALDGAHIKIIAQGKDVAEGVKSIPELLSGKGGIAVANMLEQIADSDAGKALINKITG